MEKTIKGLQSKGSITFSSGLKVSSMTMFKIIYNVNKNFLINYATWFGMWTPDNFTSRKKKLYYIYAIIIFLVAHLLNLVFQLVLIATTTNLQDLFQMFYLLNNFVLSVIKFVLFHQQRQRLKKIEKILRLKDFQAQDDHERGIRDGYHKFLRYNDKFLAQIFLNL